MAEEKEAQFDFNNLPLPDWDDVNFLWGAELSKPINILIRNINDFLCTLLPHEEIEQDIIYGTTISRNIDTAINYIDEQLSYCEDEGAFAKYFSDTQTDLVKQIIDGLNHFDEDILEDLDTSQLLDDKDWVNYMSKRQKGIRPMDEWNSYLAGEDEANYSQGFHSPFTLLKDRCVYLNNIVQKVLWNYNYGKELTKLFADLGDLLSEKCNALDKIVEDELTKIFGLRLTFILKDLNISQSDLANHLGISRTAISDWCKGKKKPSLEKVVTIATYLNTSVDYLLRPDVDRVDFEESHMLKNYGLSLKSVGMLKEIKKDKTIRDILNILLSNYKATEDYDDIDILSNLAKYLNPYYSAYVISDDVFEQLQSEILTMDKAEDIKAYITHFCKNIKDSPTNEIVRLRELETVLDRVKDKIFYKYLHQFD